MPKKNGSQLDQTTFEALAENALDAILITDMQVNLIYANPAAYKLFGCDPEKEELIGTSGARFWLEKDIPYLQQTVLPQALAGGWRGEVRNQKADGTIIDVLASAFIIHDAQNQPVNLVASIRDITDRKQIEATAHETVARLNTILNSMPIVLYTLDHQGIFTLSEGKGLVTLGLEPGQVVGMSAFDVYKDFPIIVESIKRVLTGEAFNVEFSVGPIVFENMFAPLYNATGELTGAIGISTDITTRKQAESALIDERNFSNGVLESLPSVFYLYNTEGRLVRWNRNYGAVLELSDAEMNNRYVMDNIAEEDRELIARRMQKVFVEGQADAEATLISQSGKRMSYYLTGLRLVMGDQTYLAGIGLDITERKQAEVEARRLQEQVIEAQRHALQELSTPIIPVLDRIIVMPLIGSIDSMRAKDITRSLLAGISQYRAKIVIVDITGVPLVDSGVADHLNKTIQAARLKGAQTIVTGMSDAVAEAIIDLGIDWSGIQTLSDLQTGLMVAISTLGLKLGR